MKAQLLFGAVMQITQSFAVADISIALAGNPSVNYAGATVVTHLLDYGSTRLDMGYASAIATVGLTLGITTRIGVASKCILMMLMFTGRVGGLTVVYAAMPDTPKLVSKLPQEKISVG